MCECPLSQAQEYFSDYGIMENETVLHSQPKIEVPRTAEKSVRGLMLWR